MNDSTSRVDAFDNRMVVIGDATSMRGQPLFQFEPGNSVLFLRCHGESE